MRKFDILRLILLVLIFSSSCDDASSANDRGSTDFDTESALIDESTDTEFEPFEQVGVYTQEIEGDPTDIYYPDSKPKAEESRGFPAAVMFQGGNVDKKHYARFATLLAGYGFVVAVPNNRSAFGLFADPGSAKTVCDFLQEESGREEAPIFGIVDATKSVIMGHSYGGTQAFAVLTRKSHRPQSLRAGVFWATYAMGPISNGDIPIMMLQGTLDSTNVVSAGMGEKTFDAIENPPKVFVEVQGANHYGICDVNNPPGAIAQPPKANPTLEQDTGVETIARWAGRFLRAHLLDDASSLEYVYQTGDAGDEHVTVRAVRQ